MSAARSGVEELDAALQALELVRQLTAEGHEAFARSADRRLALTYCWVNVGSLLKQYVRIANEGVPIPELSAAIRMRDRLAYQSLDDLDVDVVWRTGVRNAPELDQFLRALRRSL